MKKMALICAALSFAFLSSCDAPQTLTFAYKAQTSSVKKADDWTSCEIEAAQLVPVSTQVGQTPAFITPMQTSCYGTSCYTTGGQVIGGDVYSYDSNTALREKAENQCMSRKGYQLYVASECSKGQLPDGLTGNPSAPIIKPEGNFCVADLGFMGVPVTIVEK